MKTPCTACKHETTSTEGHRTFIGCDDPERKAKGFYNDTFWYHHTCTEQEVKDECKNCKKFDGTYCNNVYSECKFEEKEEK